MTHHLHGDASAKVKTWRRICVTAPSALTEMIASFLCGVTGQGVEQTENGEGKETVTAYLPESPSAGNQQKQIKKFLSQLQKSLPGEQKLHLSLSSIQDQDWNRKCKEHFKPENITPRVVIKPTWESYTASGGEKIIEMDPGMAFGTGHHASTRLSVQFIDQLLADPDPPRTVLDVGTGTGILAMAAVLLGAHSAFAIDNDPEAVLVATENIRRNNLQDKIETSGISLQDIPGRFGLVIANIIHGTLLSLAPKLIDRIKSGGRLILAGILAGEQEENIVASYTDLGMDHISTRQDGEWVALLFIKSCC
jgi:ribosomal protein L11 methyltransferase